MVETLPRLCYLADNRPRLLPEWAYFFLRLGHQLANLPNDDSRIVVGLAIPTRAIACGLAAAGVVLAKVLIDTVGLFRGDAIWEEASGELRQWFIRRMHLH